MLRFLSIFPYAENVHLVKDVGMVPFILHKNFGYDSYIASYKNGDYPYLRSEVVGLKQIFIKKITGISTIDVLLFLLFNSKKFDIVQCYHLGFRSLIILSFYKFLKKVYFSSSFAFLKLDAVDHIKKTKLNCLNLYLTKKINLVSVETKSIFDFLNKNNTLGRKIEYIPNGFYNKGNNTLVKFELKENLIITVGRIGIYEKNNELLLEAFKDFALTNTHWKLELIGPIEDKFKIYINNYFLLYPFLIGRVLFTGTISSRHVLKERYEKSKIFVLSSISEGFPLVFLEAMQSGNSIISSSIISAYDVTDNQKYGLIFNIGDTKGLTLALEKMVNDEAKLSSNCEAIQNFANENFSWDNISLTINNLITK